MTDCICLVIKWFPVENREPLKVELKHGCDGVCVCVCWRAWLFVVFMHVGRGQRECEICPGRNPPAVAPK